MNLPSVNEVSAVNRLALTTGSNPVPNGKKLRGYRYVKSKFELANLTPVLSDTITAPRIAECPVQMEAIFQTAHPIAEDDEAQTENIYHGIQIQRVYLEESILMNVQQRVDPIMGH